MGDIVNRVQLPIKCSNCGNKMFRVQYQDFGDKRIHTLDYCQHCDKAIHKKLLDKFEGERKWNRILKWGQAVIIALTIFILVSYIWSNYF